MIRPDQVEPLYERGFIREDQRDEFLKRMPPAAIDGVMREAVEDLAPQFIDAIIKTESAGNPNAVSPKGATGLMQVMPATGDEMAEKLGMGNYDLKNPEDNKKIGQAYFSDMLKQFGDKKLAMAAYNWGPGNVKKAMAATGATSFEELAQAKDANGQPVMPRETREYVPKVLGAHEKSQQPTLSQNPQSTFLGQTHPAPQSEAASFVDQQPSGTETPMSDDPFEIQKDAVTQGAAIGVQKAAEETAYREQLVQQQEQAQKEAEVNEQARREQLEAQAQKVEQAREEYVGSEIDSNRWWSSRSTGQKVLATLALALGTFGSARAGAPNYTYDMLQGFINKDIEEQKVAIQLKKDNLNAVNGILADMQSRFKDERVAEQQARALITENMQAKLEAMMTSYKGKESVAEGQMLYGKLEQDKQMYYQKAEEIFMKSPAYQNAVNDSLRRGVMDGTVDVNHLPEADRKRYVPGYGFAFDKDVAKDFRELASDTAQGVESLDRLIEITKKHSGAFSKALPINQEIKGEATALAEMLKGKLRQSIIGPGAMSDIERQVLSAVIRDPFAVFSFNSRNLASLESARRTVESNLGERARLSGLEAPVKMEPR